ncbi:MAG: TatD family hydrolase [Gammaproteobacteria bacterium]|nr:TatD family hydrolase [Gammaproteobacteria bacterium]
MFLVDSHCHLDFEAFDGDRDAVLERAAAAGVGAMVVPGVKRRTWERLVGLCDGRAGLYYALGLHPLFVEEHDTADLDALSDRTAALSPVAVGEIGLDFHARDADRRTQTTLFEGQLDIARSLALPVILHVRKAHDEVLGLLRRYGISGGIAHAFNGSRQQAGKYIEMGFKLGFGGMLTFERSRKLRELARTLPLDALVLETDAPDMTVSQHRGERNSPEYLPWVLEALASIRGGDGEEIAAATTRNVAEVFGISIADHETVLGRDAGHQWH